MIFDDKKKVYQKIDLNEPEYVENYGDHFSEVESIWYIGKKSSFIGFTIFLKNCIFLIISIFLKKGRRRGAPLKGARSSGSQPGRRHRPRGLCPWGVEVRERMAVQVYDRCS